MDRVRVAKQRIANDRKSTNSSDGHDRNLTSTRAIKESIMQGKLLTENEMAEFFGIKPNTAAKWRYEGKGPGYIKLSNGIVRYDLKTLHQYIQDNTVTR